MSKRIVVGIVSALLLIGVFSLAFNIMPVKSTAQTIIVIGDYPAYVSSIQAAIDVANTGDTIYVRNGTYFGSWCGHVNVNKAVALVGENRESTVIRAGDPEANGASYPSVCITASNSTVAGFTILGGRWTEAVLVSGVSGVNVSENKMYGGGHFTPLVALVVSGVSNSTFSGNDLFLPGCSVSCNNSIFFGNYISSITLSESFNNIFYGNTMGSVYSSSINHWNNSYPLGGNYWGSGYTGIDLKRGPNQDQPGHDGIGDTPYVIDANNTDYYPLMKPYAHFSAGAPYAHFNYTPNRLAGENVTFDASDSYDVNGSIVSYAWDFGDGATATSASPIATHAYGNIHSNTVKLTVTDNDGLTDTSTQGVTVGMVPTSITISTSSSSMITGFKVDIAGTLRDVYGYGLIDKTVVLSYSFSGIDTWTPITSCTTDNDGNYLATWIPTATGAFTLNASWSGTSTVFPANSTTTLNCLSYDQYVFSVESNSTISGLAFNAADRVLSFTATGPDGTKGYVSAIVAKNFTANPAGIKVLIDGNQVECSPTSTSDSCLLYFTYQHSAHNVAIDLSAAAQPTPTPNTSPTPAPTPTQTPQPTSTPTPTSNPTSTPHPGENPLANWMLYLIPAAIAIIIIAVILVWKRKKSINPKQPRVDTRN